MGEFGSILIVIAGSAATKQSRKRLAHAEARRRKEASKIASEPFEPCLAFPSRLRVKKHLDCRAAFGRLAMTARCVPATLC
jgi:hypothetical protein